MLLFGESKNLSTFLTLLLMLQMPQTFVTAPSATTLSAFSSMIYPLHIRESDLTTHQFTDSCLKVPSVSSPHLLPQSWEEWPIGA